MKIFIQLVIFISVFIENNGNKTIKVKETQRIVKALSDVTKELFSYHEIQFDTIIYGDTSAHTNNVINWFQKGGHKTEILKWDLNPSINQTVKASSVVFVASKDKLIEFLMNHKIGQKNEVAHRLRFFFYSEKPFKVEKLEINKLDAGIGFISWFSYFLINYKGKHIFDSFVR